jgi:hypothetical protein
MAYALTGPASPGRLPELAAFATSNITCAPVSRVTRVVALLGCALGSILAITFHSGLIVLAVGITAFAVAFAIDKSGLEAREERKKADLRERRRREQLARERREREQFDRQRQPNWALDPSRLDDDCAELLRRARSAVRVIRASAARAENLLEPPVSS